MFNSIHEERKRLSEGYHMSLLMPRSEYTIVYGETMNQSTAAEIVDNYLQRRDDDGQPYNIKIHDYKDSNMVEIEVNLDYENNDHVDYKIHEYHFHY